MVKNLILTEDFKLMSRLLKHSREAISHYNDKELAVMIANKRLNDFKKSLHMRNVMSVDSLSTYGWILYQQKRNKNAIKKIQSYEELFYNQTIPELVVNSSINEYLYIMRENKVVKFNIKRKKKDKSQSMTGTKSLVDLSSLPDNLLKDSPSFPNEAPFSDNQKLWISGLSLIHISEPTRRI